MLYPSTVIGIINTKVQIMCGCVTCMEIEVGQPLFSAFYN